MHSPPPPKKKIAQFCDDLEKISTKSSYPLKYSLFLKTPTKSEIQNFGWVWGILWYFVYIYIGLAYFWGFKILDLDIDTGEGGGGGGRQKNILRYTDFCWYFSWVTTELDYYLDHFYISQLILGSLVRSRFKIEICLEDAKISRNLAGKYLGIAIIVNMD